MFVGDWTGGLTAVNVADGKPAGGIDTNQPPLTEQLAAAERRLAEVAAAEEAATDQARAASDAMQLAESQLAAARQALDDATAAAEAARDLQAEATQAVERWRAELDFASQPR